MTGWAGWQSEMLGSSAARDGSGGLPGGAPAPPRAGPSRTDLARSGANRAYATRLAAVERYLGPATTSLVCDAVRSEVNASPPARSA